MWENFLKILLGKAKGRIDSLKVKEASNYILRGKETMDRPESTYIKINTLPSTTPQYYSRPWTFAQNCSSIFCRTFS